MLTSSRLRPLVLCGLSMLIASCGQPVPTTPGGPVTATVKAAVPALGTSQLRAQGLPTGTLPALHFDVTVRDASGTALTFNDGVYDPTGHGSQHTLLLNSDNGYAARLLLPAATYSFETTAKDGATAADSTNVLLAYGPSTENTQALNVNASTIALKFHSVVDAAVSTLGPVNAGASLTSNTPLDLALHPMTAPVGGTAYPVPTSDYSAPSYALPSGAQSTLGAGSALGVNVTPNDETLNVTATFQAWVRQTGTDTAQLSPVSLTYQHEVSGVTTCGTRVNLNVGEVATFKGPASAKLCLPGGAGAQQDYVVVPFNRNDTISYTPPITPLTFTATGIVASNSLSSQGLGDGSSVSSLGAAPTPAATRPAPAALPGENLNAQLANPASRIRRGALRAQSLPVGTPTSVPAVGDLLSLNAAQTCSGTADVRQARVRSVSSHAIVVEEVQPDGNGGDSPAVPGGFDTAGYDAIASNFEVVYDEVTRTFGASTDTDGNGHVVLFFTRKMNELSPPASSAVTPGQFLTKDLFSSDPVNGCANSNAGEVLYLLVPDPTGTVNSNVRTLSFVAGNETSVQAVQFTRLVNAARRAYVTGASAFEEPWLDQGLAQEANELMFYRTLTTPYYSFNSSPASWTVVNPCTPGLAPRQNIVVSNLNTGACASKRVASFNTFANATLFTQYRAYLQRPNLNSIYLTGLSTGYTAAAGATYTATAPFLRYLADRVGGDQTVFWQKLVNSNLQGLANIQNAVGGADPQDWLRDWSIANYADDDNVAGLGAQYTQPSWNYRSVFGALGGYALAKNVLADGTPLTLSFIPGGASYVRLGVATGQAATLTVVSGSSPAPDTMSISVVRLK